MRLRKIKENNRWEEKSNSKCPKCSNLMVRRGHKKFLDYLNKGNCYFFREWDYCTRCNHVQHYEEYKSYPEDFKIGEQLK